MFNYKTSGLPIFKWVTVSLELLAEVVDSKRKFAYTLRYNRKSSRLTETNSPSQSINPVW
jgi:hypothetical protein